MYWLREVDFLSLGAFGLLSLTWLVGGWLLASRLFTLRRGEQALVGVSLGLTLFIPLANLLAGPLPLTLAFWLAGVGVLAMGLVSARLSPSGRPRPRLNLRELADLLVLAALALTVVLALVQRGLGIFDEYLHLPLISTMAAGDIPPHFYLNPARPFAYHYGLQVLAAGLIRLAGFQPWSALDLSKAVALALTACLSGLWFVRLTGSRWAGLLGSAALVLGGGARWLLLLLPGPWLAALSEGVPLHNTGLDAGPDLVAALHSPWPIDGGGPIPFPFAAHNGVFVPLVSVLGSTGALPYLVVLLLVLLAGRRRPGWMQAGVFTLLLANLAISAEHWFALLWLALATVVAAAWLRTWRRSRQSRTDSGRAPLAAVLPWIGVLGGSAVLSLVQGGFITEAARSALQGWLGAGGVASSNFYGFALRWPLAVYSAHLGLLSLFNPSHLVVLLAELGPGLLLAGVASVFAWRAFQRGNWVLAAMGLSAALNMLFPIFVVYGVDRSVTRFPATALWLWLLLGLPVIWWAVKPSLTRRFAPPSPGGRGEIHVSLQGGAGERLDSPASEHPPSLQGRGAGGLGRASAGKTTGDRGDRQAGEMGGIFTLPAGAPSTPYSLSGNGPDAERPVMGSHAERRQGRRNQGWFDGSRFSAPGSRLLLLAILALGYAILVGGGLVMFGIQAASIPVPQYSYYLDALDAGMSQAWWDRLEPGAQVLDSSPSRAVTVFGRASTAHDSIYVPLPEWEALIANPDPAVAARQGFGYMYLDQEWWNELSEGQRLALEQPCVVVVESRENEGVGMRRLIDIRGCP